MIEESQTKGGSHTVNHVVAALKMWSATIVIRRECEEELSHLEKEERQRKEREVGKCRSWGLQESVQQMSYQSPCCHMNLLTVLVFLGIVGGTNPPKSESS